MPSRSIVRRAARAVGITRRLPLRRSRLELDQRRRVDRLDLGHDQVRALACDQRAHGGAVEHVEHVAAVRDLHRRCVGIAVGGDHFHAEALQFDRHFLAQLARAEQQHARGVRGQRRTERGHARSWSGMDRARCSGRLRAAPCASCAPHAPAPACPAPPSPAVRAARRVPARDRAAAATGRRDPRRRDRRDQRPGRLARASRHAVAAQRRRQRRELHRDLAARLAHRELRVAGARNTDWEDLAAFELDGRHYLLIADTGDNGGLRRTLQLHVVRRARSAARRRRAAAGLVDRVPLARRRARLRGGRGGCGSAAKCC